MSICAYCGKPIQWLRLPGGKYEPVEFLEDSDIEGRMVLAGPAGGLLAAYVPHRWNCPGGRK